MFINSFIILKIQIEKLNKLLTDYGLQMSDYNIRRKTSNFQFRPENFEPWFEYMQSKETETETET